jgi:16S rRNA U516 pseudouridylate synthase RsuA-like enzyme
LRLIRVRIGQLWLGDLSPGEWRQVDGQGWLMNGRGER